MTRVRTIRMLTCHASLTCGHHMRARVPGYYPAALLCPTCPTPGPAWITDLQVVTDEPVLVPKETTPAPAVEASAGPPEPTPVQCQLYTVGVATGHRHDSYDGPREYVLHAPTLADAIIHAARACLSDEGETEHALVDLDEDDLPAIHVVWLRTGMPLHPADTPGLGWNDLRADTPLPHDHLEVVPE